MKLSPVSDLDLTLEGDPAPGALQWAVFKNPVTGFEARANLSSTPDPVYGVPPHCSVIINVGNQDLARPNKPFLDFLLKFVPLDPAFPWTSLGNDDLIDAYNSSHTTGPGDRRYIAPALRYAVSTDAKKKATGVAALISWAISQIRRPLFHKAPFNCKSDQTINAGTADAWNTDTKVPEADIGSNAYDVAHNDLSILAAGTALGLDASAMMLWARLALVTAGHPPGTSFWMNQPRTALWRILATIWYGYSQFELGDSYLVTTFFKGHKAKADMRGFLEQYMALGVDPPVAGGPDARVMCLIPSKLAGNDELHGKYPWQDAMRTAGWGMAIASKLVSGPLLVQLTTYANAEIAKNLERHRGPKGMAWAASMHEFTRADADKALAEALPVRKAEVDAGARVYEAHPLAAAGTTTAKFVIREEPIPQDLGLHLLGLALILGPFSEPVETLLPMAGVPGKPSWQGTKPPYESKVTDPVYALREVRP